MKLQQETMGPVARSGLGPTVCVLIAGVGLLLTVVASTIDMAAARRRAERAERQLAIEASHGCPTLGYEYVPAMPARTRVHETGEGFGTERRIDSQGFDYSSGTLYVYLSPADGAGR